MKRKRKKPCDHPILLLLKYRQQDFSPVFKHQYESIKKPLQSHKVVTAMNYCKHKKHLLNWNLVWIMELLVPHYARQKSYILNKKMQLTEIQVDLPLQKKISKVCMQFLL